MEHDPNDQLKIRKATIADSETILFLVKELGKFEKAPEEEMPVTLEQIQTHIFKNHYCHVLIVENDKTAIGLCTYYYSFTLIIGKPSIIIEDFFVVSEFRRKGIGIMLFRELAKIALEGCEKIEWAVLTWNEPALKFYQKIGAKQVSGNVEYSLNNEQFQMMKE
jgi:GNAT superfamily N-acetyltransferase